MKRRLLTGAVLALALTLAACGGDDDDATPGAAGTTAAKAPTKVTLGIGIRTPVAQQAMETYLPIALGYWKDENLDVTIQGFDGTGASVQALLAKQIDGVNSAGTNTIASANESGQDLKCFVTGITHSYLYTVKMPNRTDITGFKDLAKKKLGVLSLQASQYNWAVAALRDAGVDPKDVTFLPVGAGPEAAQALKAGQIDMLLAFDGAAILAQNLVGAVRVDAPFLDKLGFNTCMAAPQSWIDQNKQVAIGLARGYMKAVVFAKANPKAAVQAFWDAYPPGRPTGDLAAALDSTASQLEVRLGAIRPTDGKYGTVADQVVKDQIAALVAGGALKASMEPSKVWTSELIAEINKFDVAAIEKQAKEWKKS